MTVVHIILLAISTALICSMLRTHRPEIAGMVSLAAGLGILLLCADTFSKIASSIRAFMNRADIQTSEMQILLKAAGLAILGEMGVEICRDAGESALAGRIRLVCRIAMLSMAMPFVTQIIGIVSSSSF